MPFEVRQINQTINNNTEKDVKLNKDETEKKQKEDNLNEIDEEEEAK